MNEYAHVMLLGTLIISMNLIQIIIIIVKDLKIWAKLDRIVNFFMNERNSIVSTIGSIRSIVEDTNKEIAKLKKEVNKNVDKNKQK